MAKEIKDVSTQWAAMFESATVEDKRYTEACEKSTAEAEEIKEQEIDEFDVEVIDPSECGFEVANEALTAAEIMKKWKEDHADDVKVSTNMKVDNNYITKMKKLLAPIKTSKAAVYARVFEKLAEYMNNGTELPCPEDYAENFLPFDKIQAAGAPDSENYKDTDNAFGNEMAMQNMYDSDLTEAEEASVKNEFADACKKAQEATKNDPEKDEVKEYLKNHKADIDKACKKLDPKVQDRVRSVVKILEKWADGEISEAKKKDSIPTATIKLLFRLLNLIVFGLPVIAGKGLKLLGAVGGLLDKYSQKALDKVDDKIVGEAMLAVEDDKEMLEAEQNDENAEKLAKECSESNEQDEEKANVKEADYREAASHLLDPAGVKASTASLKAQDTALLTVVEALCKKLNENKKEEQKLDESSDFMTIAEAKKYISDFVSKNPDYGILIDVKVGSSTPNFNVSMHGNTLVFSENSSINSKVKQAISPKLIDVDKLVEIIKSSGKKWKDITDFVFEDQGDFLRVRATDDVYKGYKTLTFYFTSVSRKKYGDFFDEAETKEKQKLDEDEFIEIDDFFKESEFSAPVKEADDSFEDKEDDEIPAGPSPEIQKKISRVKYFQNLEFDRELTDDEVAEVRKLIDEIPEHYRYLVELSPSGSGFERPHNHTGIRVTDIGGDEERHEVPPFNPNATVGKPTKKGQKDQEDSEDAAIVFPKRGSKKAWTVTEWNRFLSSIDKEERDLIMNEIIADIENMTPEEAEETSGPDLKGKPTDMQKAWQVSFVKSIFGQYTKGNKLKIDTRDLGRLLGKSHVGVGKYANDTLDMINTATSKILHKTNPTLADFNRMTPDEFRRVKEYVKIQSDGKQRRKGGLDDSPAPTTSLTTLPHDGEDEEND